MSGQDFHHRGTGLLRASARSFQPSHWPVLGDEQSCRDWLAETWPEVAAVVGHASPPLAARVDAILQSESRSERELRRATAAVVRYVLRFGRSTPFGLFAGVAPVAVDDTAAVRVGYEHRAVVRPDNRWLRQVITTLEACPELLARLRVVFHDAAERVGDRLMLDASESVSIRYTQAVEFVRLRSITPVGITELAEKLTSTFPAAGNPVEMLQSLVEHGFLITGLHAPSTVTDPLGHLVEALRAVHAYRTPIAALAKTLREIHTFLSSQDFCPDQSTRARLAERMAAITSSPRGPLSVDLRLDAAVRIPSTVAAEMERTAGVLARLVREHTGARAWRDYFAAFCDRYGTGTLVPLRTVIGPAGPGWPGGYPSGPQAGDKHVVSERDSLLLSWITDATVHGKREIELDGAMINALAETGGNPGVIPPHLDFGARIHAATVQDLDNGHYRFTAAPGRSAGTLSSRFSPLVSEAGLTTVFVELPTSVSDALAVQVSFTPAFGSAENVSRVPRYLPDVIAVGEHHADHTELIELDDLAVTATRRRLHLVSMSRRQVVEPLQLHALAPKQQPPLARFLTELPRALDSGWIGFDWGPVAAAMPFRPRLRYRHAIFSPARWRLARNTLPTDTAAWDDALARWRTEWRCPALIELQDFDQQLPLDLTVTAHREVLYHHLRRHDEAELLEAPAPASDGWLDGHAHLVVLPLTARRPPEPGPAVGSLPVLGRGHGQPPESVSSEWLYVKLFLDERRVDALLARELSELLAAWGERPWWFVRFPHARDGDEPDHLRLRIHVDNDRHTVLTALGAWADQLRADGLLSRWALDTYYPEVGRYLAIRDVEAVFAADSRYVHLRLAHTTPLPPLVTVGLSLFDLASAFLGDPLAASIWLEHHAPAAVPDHDDVSHITTAIRHRAWPEATEVPAVATALRVRAETVRRYRAALPDDANLDACLQSLLHMHHNRALGVDRDREAVCLRLARQAAITWRATRRLGTL